MSSSFFKPFYVCFAIIIVFTIFLSCFFGPIISGNFDNEEPFYSFDLNGEYLWPTPRLYYN